MKHNKINLRHNPVITRPVRFDEGRFDLPSSKARSNSGVKFDPNLPAAAFPTFDSPSAPQATPSVDMDLDSEPRSSSCDTESQSSASDSGSDLEFEATSQLTRAIRPAPDRFSKEQLEPGSFQKAIEETMFEDRVDNVSRRNIQDGPFRFVEWSELTDGIKVAIMQTMNELVIPEDTLLLLALRHQDINHYMRLLNREIAREQRQMDRTEQFLNRMQRQLAKGSCALGPIAHAKAFDEDIREHFETSVTYYISEAAVEDAICFLSRAKLDAIIPQIRDLMGVQVDSSSWARRDLLLLAAYTQPAPRRRGSSSSSSQNHPNYDGNHSLLSSFLQRTAYEQGKTPARNSHLEIGIRKDELEMSKSSQQPDILLDGTSLSSVNVAELDRNMRTDSTPPLKITLKKKVQTPSGLRNFVIADEIEKEGENYEPQPRSRTLKLKIPPLFLSSLSSSKADPKVNAASNVDDGHEGRSLTSPTPQLPSNTAMLAKVDVKKASITAEIHRFARTLTDDPVDTGKSARMRDSTSAPDWSEVTNAITRQAESLRDANTIQSPDFDSSSRNTGSGPFDVQQPSTRAESETNRDLLGSSARRQTPLLDPLKHGDRQLNKHDTELNYARKKSALPLRDDVVATKHSSTPSQNNPPRARSDLSPRVSAESFRLEQQPVPNQKASEGRVSHHRQIIADVLDQEIVTLPASRQNSLAFEFDTPFVPIQSRPTPLARSWLDPDMRDSITVAISQSRSTIESNPAVERDTSAATPAAGIGVAEERGVANKRRRTVLPGHESPSMASEVSPTGRPMETSRAIGKVEVDKSISKSVRQIESPPVSIPENVPDNPGLSVQAIIPKRGRGRPRKIISEPAQVLTPTSISQTPTTKPAIVKNIKTPRRPVKPPTPVESDDGHHNLRVRPKLSAKKSLLVSEAGTISTARRGKKRGAADM